MSAPDPDSSDSFTIYSVGLANLQRSSGDELYENSKTEQMGSKEKFWVRSMRTNTEWLAKLARDNADGYTGEHWSEKLAAEVASVLGVPRPDVELGHFRGHPVSLTESFLQPGESLIHGNELVSMVDPNYPSSGPNYRTQEHTLGAIRDAFVDRNVGGSDESRHSDLSAFGLFTGYLLLDALICNTDRHHENWAVIASGPGTDRRLRLAPSL